MIDRYTPPTRERKTSQPKAKARTPGASSTISIANQNWSKPHQYHGSASQLRNTMKSGSSALPYMPRVPIWRIRYMPMA